MIIPVYNVKKYLCESIDSVIDQTYKNLEILVIDDGSTDGSGEICDEYQKKDPRIRVIHQKNGGLSAARNTGLDAMQGDVVAFLDSDDAFLPDMIEVLVNEMEKTSADMAVCKYFVMETTGKMDKPDRDKKRGTNGETEVLSSKEALNRLMECKMQNYAWNKLYARHLFDEARFPVGYVFEDKLLMPYIFEKAEKITVIPVSLVYYRMRPNSIERTISEKNALDRLNAEIKRQEFILAHTPDIFSQNRINKFFEPGNRRLMEFYLMFRLKCFKTHVSLKNVRSAYETELKKRVADSKDYSFETKLLFRVFAVSPVLCVVLFYGIGTVRNIINKAKKAFSRRQ